MALTSTEPTTKTTNVSLTASLDRALELQITFQGKAIDLLEIAPKGDIWPAVSIQSFDGWTLAASHTTTRLVTWDVDRTGSVSHTFGSSGTVIVELVATQPSTSTQKKKSIKIAIKPVGSDKGGVWGDGDDENDGPGRGHGHGRR